MKIDKDNVKIIRKRYIPDEEVDISLDKIIYLDEKLLVTEWLPIHLRDDISKGKSYTYLKEGYKVSLMYDDNDNLKYYYCDIIDVVIKDNVIKLIDLLVDVVIYPNNEVRVVDLEELAEASNKKLITQLQVEDSLIKTNKLLNLIYNNKFPFEEIKNI